MQTNVLICSKTFSQESYAPPDLSQSLFTQSYSPTVFRSNKILQLFLFSIIHPCSTVYLHRIFSANKKTLRFSEHPTASVTPPLGVFHPTNVLSELLLLFLLHRSLLLCIMYLRRHHHRHQQPVRRYIPYLPHAIYPQEKCAPGPPTLQLCWQRPSSPTTMSYTGKTATGNGCLLGWVMVLGGAADGWVAPRWMNIYDFVSLGIHIFQEFFVFPLLFPTMVVSKCARFSVGCVFPNIVIVVTIYDCVGSSCPLDSQWEESNCGARASLFLL